MSVCNYLFHFDQVCCILNHHSLMCHFNQVCRILNYHSPRWAFLWHYISSNTKANDCKFWQLIKQICFYVCVQLFISLQSTVRNIDTVSKRRVFLFQGGHLYNVISPKIKKLMTANFDSWSNRYASMTVCNYLFLFNQFCCIVNDHSLRWAFLWLYISSKRKANDCKFWQLIKQTCFYVCLELFISFDQVFCILIDHSLRWAFS